MAYIYGNPRTKSSLRERLESGRVLRVFEPGIQVGPPPKDGWVTVEGPHYPEPHRWYAEVLLVDGVVKEVK